MEIEKDISDEKLIQLFNSSRDQRYLGQLYINYKALIFGVCLKYLKNEEDAKDASTDIYEILHKKISNQNIENFKPWLYVVVKNHCFEKLRKRTKEKIKESEAGNMYSDEIFHPDINNELLYVKMEDCMKTLKQEQRLCIEGFYYKKESYQVIAQNQELSWNQVRSLIQNGRRKLKICMEE